MLFLRLYHSSVVSTHLCIRDGGTQGGVVVRGGVVDADRSAPASRRRLILLGIRANTLGDTEATTVALPYIPAPSPSNPTPSAASLLSTNPLSADRLYTQEQTHQAH